MSLGLEDLEPLLEELRERGTDTADVEVKSARDGLPGLGPTLSAFGNMPDGGTIILGVDERAGFSLVGLSNAPQLEQGLASLARDQIEPPVTCEFQQLSTAGGQVLIAAVQPVPLQARPVRFHGKAYVRVSDGDYEMSQVEIAQIEAQKALATGVSEADRRPITGSSLEDLDQDLLAEFIQDKRSRSRHYAEASEKDILRNTNVVTESGELTLAACYSMGKFPKSARPDLGITAAVSDPDAAGVRTADLVHLEGPIPDLLTDAMAWVKRNIAFDMAYNADGHGVDVPELPLDAVREVIANALVHRSLEPVTSGRSVEIRLLPNRLVVTSPGGLWRITRSRLGRPGTKTMVNPVLYDQCLALRTRDGLRVIEGEGMGLRTAMKLMDQAGLKLYFSDNGLDFTAIFMRRQAANQATGGPRVARDPAVSEGSWKMALQTGGAVSSTQRAGQDDVRRSSSPLSERARLIADALGEGDMSVKQLVERTGLSVSQVRYALRPLIERGTVEMCGKQGNRGTTYRLVAEPPE